VHPLVYWVGAVIVNQAFNWDAVQRDGHGFAVYRKLESSVVGKWAGVFNHPFELQQLFWPLRSHVLTGAGNNLLKIRHVGFAKQALGD
jgi:hypothetical protein